MKTDIQEDQAYLYLLDELPEAEQLALEQRYFADREAFERVWEIENQLVDRYVRGRLTPAEKNLFQQSYLASSPHRDRVVFARTLVEAADSTAELREAHTRTEPAISWWSSFPDSLRGKSWRWATIAAVLVLAAAGVGLLSERARLHEQIGRLKDQSASKEQRVQELEKEMTAEREQSDKLAVEIERLQEESRNAEVPSQILPSRNEPRSVISFLLSPMSMRSGGEAQQLRISKETTVVLLRMTVQEPDALMFQADLRTVEGAQVWSRGSIKAHGQARNASVVSANIPASKLGAGDYILTLSATNGSSETQEIDRFFFRVPKQ